MGKISKFCGGDRILLKTTKPIYCWIRRRLLNSAWQTLYSCLREPGGKEGSLSFLLLNSFAGNECFLSLPFTVVKPTPDNTIALCFVSAWLYSIVRNACLHRSWQERKEKKEKRSDAGLRDAQQLAVLLVTRVKNDSQARQLENLSELSE